MKKTVLKIVTVCLFLIFLSAYNSNPTDNRLGCYAPNFNVENENGEMELQQKKGRYVLLSFWKSNDANSRVANMMYDRTVRNLEGIDYVAVNFDTSYGVYREIVKNDGLDSTAQFYDMGGVKSLLYSRYELARGMKSFLLDKSGKIIAENPDAKELETLIREN